MYNMQKFSLAQMTSNSDGKTSGSGTMGAITVAVSLLCFVAGVVDYMLHGRSEIMAWSTGVLGMGIGLMGYRKSKGGTTQAQEHGSDE